MSHRKVETVFTRDNSSGRIHVRFIVNGKAATFEGDNADTSGAFTEITEAEALAAPPELQCARCFPRMVNGEVPKNVDNDTVSK